MAICVFSTISYSIVKCSFVCLFVVALDPCKIKIEKYTNVVLFLSFPALYWQNYSRTLTSARVCLSVCLCLCVSVMFNGGGGGLCLCVCLSVRFFAKVCVCVRVFICVYVYM